MEEDMEKAASNLKKIDSKDLAGDSAKKIYDKIAEASFEEASEKIYIQGRDAYNGENADAGQKDSLKRQGNSMKK